MKKIYLLSILFSLVIFSGCSKDFLKSYEDRVIGTWSITDVDRVGIGGNSNNLPFQNGSFTFHENGTLTYVNLINIEFKGTWEIKKKVIGEESIRSLHVTAIDFTKQQVLSEYYDDMNFTGTDKFNATIYSGARNYVTYFRR